MSLPHGTLERLTADLPALDGRMVAGYEPHRFCTIRRNGASDLYQKVSNGAGPEDLLLQVSGCSRRYAYDWSPDGHFLLYGASGALGSRHSDLWYLPLAGDDRKPKALSPDSHSAKRKGSFPPMDVL